MSKDPATQIKTIQALSLRDNAKHQLEQIKDIETGVRYLSKVKAIEVWAKAERKDAELQNMIAEQKVRTQRILGQLLTDNETKKIGLQNLKNVGVSNGDSDRNLSDYGITRNESSDFQKIASMPEEAFEQEIRRAKDESTRRVELTTSRLLRAADKYDAEVSGRPFRMRVSTYLQGTIAMLFEFHLGKKVVVQEGISKEEYDLRAAEYIRGLIRDDLTSRYEIGTKGIVKLRRS